MARPSPPCGPPVETQKSSVLVLGAMFGSRLVCYVAASAFTNAAPPNTGSIAKVQIETCVLRMKRRRMGDREGDLFMYNDNGCVFVRINRHSGKKLPPVQAQIASENAPALLRHVPGKPNRCRDRKSSKR